MSSSTPLARILEARNMIGPYEILSAFGAEGAHGSPEERRRYLWQNLSRLAEALQNRLTQLGTAPYLEQVTIYMDDPFYKQGAAAVLFDFRFDSADPFRVRATCLVDHSSIRLRVISPPRDARFDEVRRVLEPSDANEPE